MGWKRRLEIRYQGKRRIVYWVRRGPRQRKDIEKRFAHLIVSGFVSADEIAPLFFRCSVGEFVARRRRIGSCGFPAPVRGFGGRYFSWPAILKWQDRCAHMKMPRWRSFSYSAGRMFVRERFLAPSFTHERHRKWLEE
jgi:hypothetical protein